MRGPDLLHHALAQDRDPVAERHRLGLVMGDVDRGDAQAALQPSDLGAHLAAELGIQVRQRLIEEERIRLSDDRAAHRDTLPLPAGEVGRLTFQVLGQLQDVSCLIDQLFTSASGVSFSRSGNAMFSNTLRCGYNA